MTLSQFRSKLYALARIAGDVQAATHKNPARPSLSALAAASPGRSRAA